MIRNGGRVMKNVTGYDLVKLMAGSYGTLGVLTEVALKVLPKSEVTGTLRLDGLCDAQAIAALSDALGSPYEVTGAAHLQHGPQGASATLIRLEGFANSVSYRADALRRLLAAYGDAALELDPDANEATWCDIRDVASFRGADGAVWRLSVKPSDAPGIVAELPGCRAVYDWGGGLVWLLVPAETALSGAELRARIAPHGGHATLIRGYDPSPFHPQAAPVAALEAGLRRKFDPKSVLNPGLMGPVA